MNILHGFRLLLILWTVSNTLPQSKAVLLSLSTFGYIVATIGSGYLYNYYNTEVKQVIVNTYHTVNEFRESIKCEYISNKIEMDSVKYLKMQMESNVFGQHIASEIIIASVKAHLMRVNWKTLRKALVLSFNGWTGGGKNYVTKFIAEAVLENGMKDTNFHLFISTLHFPDPTNTAQYKQDLRRWITGNMTRCNSAIFVFDEVDKMPEGVIDAILPFIDVHEEIDGVDYRRAIFLILSNAGAKMITRKMMEIWNRDGNTYNRKLIKSTDFEIELDQGAFNDAGGLRHSEIIERHLIDAFIPFLPLEVEHVKKCAKIEAIRQKKSLTATEVEQVVQGIRFWPENLKLFSTTGCKKVAHRVDLIIANRNI